MCSTLPRLFLAALNFRYLIHPKSDSTISAHANLRSNIFSTHGLLLPRLPQSIGVRGISCFALLVPMSKRSLSLASKQLEPQSSPSRLYIITQLIRELFKQRTLSRCYFFWNGYAHTYQKIAPPVTSKAWHALSLNPNYFACLRSSAYFHGRKTFQRWDFHLTA